MHGMEAFDTRVQSLVLKLSNSISLKHLRVPAKRHAVNISHRNHLQHPVLLDLDGLNSRTPGTIE